MSMAHLSLLFFADAPASLDPRLLGLCPVTHELPLHLQDPVDPLAVDGNSRPMSQKGLDPPVTVLRMGLDQWPDLFDSSRFTGEY